MFVPQIGVSVQSVQLVCHLGDAVWYSWYRCYSGTYSAYNYKNQRSLVRRSQTAEFGTVGIDVTVVQVIVRLVGHNDMPG